MCWDLGIREIREPALSFYFSGQSGYKHEADIVDESLHWRVSQLRNTSKVDSPSHYITLDYILITFDSVDLIGLAQFLVPPVVSWTLVFLYALTNVSLLSSLAVTIQKVAGTIESEEFRPINMLQTLQKILELVVKDQLMDI